MIISSNKKGFTLIELLVVIATIALLASIILASLNSSRVRARNLNRTQIAKQYVNALELYHSDHAGYPCNDCNNDETTEESLYFCLGFTTSQSCYGPAFPGSDTLNSALLPYFSALPKNSDQVSISLSNLNGTLYNCVDVSNGICQSYQLKWVLEGIDNNCGGGNVLSTFLPTNSTCEIIN